MKRRLEHVDIKNLGVGKKISESVVIGGRGDGALMFWRRSPDVIESYYRYREKGSDTIIKIGVFKTTRDNSGFSLAECREKAREFACLRRENNVGDLKQYLEVQEIERLAREREAKLQAEQEAGLGTFWDMCDTYTNQLQREGKKDWKKAKNLFEKHVFREFPHLRLVKAKDIRDDDIIEIIHRMIEKGITTTCNRVRSYLHAAFNYGIKSDKNPRERYEHGKKYNIPLNPVSGIPRQADFERVRERVLSHQEIAQLWHEFPKRMTTISPMYGLLIRFMFACGGNRPKQLSRCRWSDFDLKNRTFSFVDYKGKNTKGTRRVMPMSDRAMEIIMEVLKISGGFDLVFTIRGKSPISESNLAHKIDDFYELLKAEAHKENRTLPDKYTAKDIRRTVTGLLIEARIPREQRFLLQSRKDGTVESKHYDHSDRLNEKYESLSLYDDLLGKVLKGETGNLIDLKTYRLKVS